VTPRRKVKISTNKLRDSTPCYYVIKKSRNVPILEYQELISRSVRLLYSAYVMAFSQDSLF